MLVHILFPLCYGASLDPSQHGMDTVCSVPAQLFCVIQLPRPEGANIHASIMDVWRRHLGTISAPSCQSSVSVTSTAADGGRLVKGWDLVNRAVKFNNISPFP